MFSQISSLFHDVQNISAFRPLLNLYLRFQLLQEESFLWILIEVMSNSEVLLLPDL